MASTGLAIKSAASLLIITRAAIGSLERSFYVQTPARQENSSTYKGDRIMDDSRSSKDFVIKRLSLAVKINKFGFQCWLQTSSSVNYQFTGSSLWKVLPPATQLYTRATVVWMIFYWPMPLPSINISTLCKSIVPDRLINQTETFIDVHPRCHCQCAEDYYHRIRLEYGAQYFTQIGKSMSLH